MTRRETQLAQSSVLVLDSDSHPQLLLVSLCPLRILLGDTPHIPYHSTQHTAMKPPMQEELEDDLAAEEENKLINEVLQPPYCRSQNAH